MAKLPVYPLFEGAAKLLSSLPPEAYQLAGVIVNGLLRKKPAEALEDIRRAALAVAYKKGALAAADAALAARKKLLGKR